MDEISVPFTGFNLCDSDAVRKYHDHLEVARNMAQLKPMEPGLCFDVDLVIPPASPHPNARSLPPLPVQSSSKFTLRLNLPLQSDLDRFSQVWTAVVEGFGAAQSAIQTTLVLKIIQPSMCPYLNIDDHWVGNYTFPEYTARLEAMVYDRLANKQGLSIPYFFGIHTILTPSNDIAWALVLEHIPGQTLQAYADSTNNKTIQESRELLKLSLDTLTDFTMSDGWYHLDLVPRNIIVVGPPGKRGVVFVDLYSATMYENRRIKEGLLLERHRLYATIRDALEDYTEELEQWANENLRSDPLAMGLTCSSTLPLVAV